MNFILLIRRILALIIDACLMIIVGHVISMMFSNYLVNHVKIAEAIGFIVAVTYHGIGSSKLFSGQTLGKQILGIKLISVDGKYIGVFKSLFRSIFVVIPLFQLNFVPRIDSIGLIAVLSVPYVIAFFYNLVFKSVGLHDIISRTFVVDVSSSGPFFYFISKQEAVLIISISVLVLGLDYGIKFFINRSSANENAIIESLQDKIKKMPGISDVGIELASNRTVIAVTMGKNEKSTNLWMDDIHAIATPIFCMQPNGFKIKTIIYQGFDMGIYKKFETFEREYTIGDQDRNVNRPK